MVTFSRRTWDWDLGACCKALVCSPVGDRGSVDQTDKENSVDIRRDIRQRSPTVLKAWYMYSIIIGALKGQRPGIRTTWCRVPALSAIPGRWLMLVSCFERNLRFVDFGGFRIKHHIPPFLGLLLLPGCG